MEKKNLCSRFLVLLLLLPLLTLSSTYTRPDKFYINCGSDSNITYGNQTFIGDTSSSGGFGNSVSFTKKGTEAINQSDSSTSPELYQTVRTFKHTSSYKFKLDSTGLHFVRLHFFSPTTQPFTVSTNHFKNFLVQNFNVTPLVEEFLLMIDSLDFEIRFVPRPSSVAIINAIEVFSAPKDYDKNLRTVYRLNVGGNKIIAPEIDSLGRTWLLDDEFLYRKDSARNISRTQQKVNYEEEELLPDLVYQTAKTMNRSTSEKVDVLMNVTWSFKVKSNTKHFIRAHFCDIKSNGSSGNSSSDFYLFVNGQWRLDVKPSEKVKLMTPFYIDVLNVSDGSGVLNISIGTKDPGTDAGFLNGLELMEFLRDSDSKSSFRVYVIVGCVVAAAIVSVLVLCLLFIVKRWKKKEEDEADLSVRPTYKGGGGSSDNRSLSLKIPFNDILRATNNFDDKCLIGKGGFGNVYKAILLDGSKAAIKRGKTSSGQGILEFQTEIQLLSRIRHRHLVSLKGYCDEHSEMILVYEFMEKGTLKDHLYGGPDLPSLPWKQRLEICIGAANGLHYLHNGSQGAIIHRDVKSTNILLDENNVAKVADFGLSKLVVRNRDQINVVSNNIKGTFGYLDPEYLQTHILTEKSDVYAFGVVLLEVLCARPALSPHLPHEKVNLAEWAMFCKSKDLIDETLDPKLTGQIEPNSLRKFMEIAEKCLNEYGEDRPSMGDVIWDLEYVLQLQMMTNIHREPHEDSVASISSNSLVIPRLMVNDSFSSNSMAIPRLMVSDSSSSNSIVQKKEYEGSTTSSENRVFSQLKISEAR